MKLDTMFPSKYLKHEDFPHAEVLTIKSVELEEVGQERDEKPVIYFKEIDKGLVLNKTNCYAIAEIDGNEDTDEWAGTQIEVYGTTTLFQGKKTPCLRIRAPRATKPAATKHADIAPPDAVFDGEEEIPEIGDDEPMRSGGRWS